MAEGELGLLWVYLAERPLLWLSVTLGAYAIGDACFRAAGGAPAVNPVLIAVALIAVALAATGTDYATYFEGAQFVHFLLGPATVALALPLHANLGAMRRAALPIFAAVVTGAATAILVAVGTAWALGAEPETILSLAPKSATTPIAMGVAEKIGGIPTLAAIFVILTGILGAVAASPLLDRLGLRDPRARGLATGIAAHGIGIARAFQVGETNGAFASLGMGLGGLATAILVPLIVSLL